MVADIVNTLKTFEKICLYGLPDMPVVRLTCKRGLHTMKSKTTRVTTRLLSTTSYAAGISEVEGTVTLPTLLLDQVEDIWSALDTLPS